MDEKLILSLTFNPGLELTSFRTTRPRCIRRANDKVVSPCSQQYLDAQHCSGLKIESLLNVLGTFPVV